MELNTFLNDYKTSYINTLNHLDEKKIDSLLEHLEEARDSGRSIFMLGNGGSAASASHWVCDFNKGAYKEGKLPFKINCLSDNTPILTALGNDVSYDSVFSTQLRNYLSEGDLVIALSVSGNSANLVEAVNFAKSKGAYTFSVIGDLNGLLKDLCDESLIVPSKNYGIVEDVHMYLAHVLSQYIAVAK